MKNKLAVLLLISALLLGSCGRKTPEAPATENTRTTVPDVTQTIYGAAETGEPTHSELYLPDCSAQQMEIYFEEVVLNMEYDDGTGDSSLVQKWQAPIGLRICGDPTEEDLAVLNGLFARLNQIPGFPGFYTAEAEGLENLRISFLNPADFRDSFSSAINGEDAWGATEFWYYTESNEIHTARIGYRTDIEQSSRNAILVEEIINALGISDTVLREDSVVYQYSNENTALSDVDWVILNLLYDPSVHCGMNETQCMRIVRQLYY